MRQEAIDSAAHERADAAYFNGDPDTARDLALDILRQNPDDRNALKLLLQSAEAIGDTGLAEMAVARIEALPFAPDTFDLLLDRALVSGEIGRARTYISEADAAGVIRPEQSAIGKARIALVIGDLEAAAAILVMAIEAHPSHAGLRRLMTETLLARGSAGHARDVLAHLGQPPTEYDADGKPLPTGTRDSA